MKKVCLVGCGRIARTHARNLLGKVELCFYSRSQESAQRLAAQFGNGPVFPVFDEVLAAPQVEALVIASPPEFHCAQAIAGLAAGKSVLVEKPMCVSNEEMQQLGAAVEACAGPFLMVAENYYYKPSVELLQWLLRRDSIGAPEQVQVKKLFAQHADGWKCSYGALLEGGIHFVALISALFEAMGHAAPERITGEFPGFQAATPERCSVVRLSYPGGVTAELRYAWNMPRLFRGTLQHSHIVGEAGKIVFESNGMYVWLHGKERKWLYFPGVRDLMGSGAMIRDFLQCLEGERQPRSSFERAKRDLEIVFEAYRQRGLGGV